MTYGSFLCPPQIHLEQEDPFNLDKDNNMIEGSLLYKSCSKGFQGLGVPGSKGPIYLKLTFKYELDSKEGQSCLCYKDLEKWTW